MEDKTAIFLEAWEAEKSAFLYSYYHFTSWIDFA